MLVYALAAIFVTVWNTGGGRYKRINRHIVCITVEEESTAIQKNGLDWINAGPTSLTLAQHWSNSGLASRVCRVEDGTLAPRLGERWENMMMMMTEALMTACDDDRGLDGQQAWPAGVSACLGDHRWTHFLVWRNYFRKYSNHVSNLNG